MATERQIAANRLNAERCTGPKTPEGKAVVSQNAVTHGLTCYGGLLPGENPEDFSDLSARVLAELSPDSAIEIELAEQIASLLWRLRRIPAFEVVLLAWANAACEQSLFLVAPPRFSANGQRPPGGLKDILDFGRSLDAFLQGDAGGKLTRYETALRRQLAASMAELRQMQERRAQGSATVCLRAAIGDGVPLFAVRQDDCGS